MLQIHESEEQLARAGEEPLRWIMAAKAAHLALQAALTAALAGSMGIGAYDGRLEARWLAFLQDGAPQPQTWRVMEFTSLLQKARTQPLEWTGRPLLLTDEEATQLGKLTAIRDGVEHTKPGFWVIEPAVIKPLIALAIQTAIQLLKGIHHHFEVGELENAEARASEIAVLCSL